MTLNWQPTATVDTLRERARLIATVRAFFAARDIWEVETPVLGQGGSTDVHLVSLATLARTDKGQRKLWLQTSPEFHMKRLLAADSGPIFQLAKSFRDGEVGARHNIEFTMLEWYRPGFTLAQLIEETTALVAHVLPQPPGPVVHYRYRELFHRLLAVDPFTTSLETLRTLAAQRGNMPVQALVEEGRDTCLDLLMGMVIEPTLGQQELSVVVDYPASQAALARRHQDADGEWVASRFELYMNGIELANGYDELTDAEEQRQRFDADNAERRRLGLTEVEVDAHLLAALEQGLPASSGVALGLDRLIQLALGKARLEEVLAFSTANC